jgi:hypothetical protein
LEALVCNPSTREAELGGSGVQDQPKLHKETMSQKTKTVYGHTTFNVPDLVSKNKLKEKKRDEHVAQ